MSTLSDAHTQWHQIFGKYATCDLDCGAGEIVGQIFEEDWEDTKQGTVGIRCGSCKGRHASVATVNFCYEVARDTEKRKLADAYV